MEEKDFDEFFEGDLDGTNPEIEATTEDAATEVAEPEVQTETQAETVTEAVEPESEERGHHVPIAALLDTRDKLKEAQARLAEYERIDAERKAAERPAAKVPKTPDPYDDPDGFQAAILARAETMAREHADRTRFAMSEKMATTTYGAEAVKTAADWARARGQTDEAFADAILAHPDPVEAIIREHQRSTRLEAFEADPDEFVRRRAAELGIVPHASGSAAQATVSTKQPAANSAPRSIANTPSITSKATTITSESAFDDIFNRE